MCFKSDLTDAYVHTCPPTPLSHTDSKWLTPPETKSEWKPAIWWWWPQSAPVWWWSSLANGWVCASIWSSQPFSHMHCYTHHPRKTSLVIRIEVPPGVWRLGLQDGAASHCQRCSMLIVWNSCGGVGRGTHWGACSLLFPPCRYAYSELLCEGRLNRLGGWILTAYCVSSKGGVNTPHLRLLFRTSVYLSPQSSAFPAADEDANCREVQALRSAACPCAGCLVSPM